MRLKGWFQITALCAGLAPRAGERDHVGIVRSDRDGQDIVASQWRLSPDTSCVDGQDVVNGIADVLRDRELVARYFKL